MPSAHRRSLVVKRKKSPKIGVALGGGAARGLAHIGVLEALEEGEIPIDIVAGTSMGALVGACYAAFPDAKKLHEALLRFIYSEHFPVDRFNFFKEHPREELGGPGVFEQVKKTIQKGIFYGASVTRKSFVAEEDFRKDIETLLPDIRIEELALPFIAVATDLNSGEEVLIDSGSIREAVLASSAIPGVFPPVIRNGHELVDGGWVHNVPVGPARKLGADFVIAVDISREIDDSSDWKRGLNIIFRTNSIAREILKKTQLREADFCLRPDIGQMHWADFSEPEECIARGKEEVYRNLEKIRSRIVRAKPQRRSRRPSSKGADGRDGERAKL